MKPGYLVFDESAARVYRKTSLVLAFRSDDAFVFFKPWGEERLPEGSWVIVPLMNGQPTGDVYGCHRESFVQTYRPVGDADHPYTYEKHAVVHAYQPGKPFAVRTSVNGYAEVDPAIGGATDWAVRNVGGEIYPVSDLTFRGTYRLAE